MTLEDAWYENWYHLVSEAVVLDEANQVLLLENLDGKP